jgi:MraZ protein
MTFFKGQEQYSIDSKGRFVVPLKMRVCVSKDATNTFVATLGYEKCIDAFPLDIWKKQEEKLEKLNPDDYDNRLYLRNKLMWAEEIVLDAQHRLCIPQLLLNQVGIEDNSKITIVGMRDHLEVWNPLILEAYLKGQKETYEEVAQKVMVVPKYVKE